MCNKGGGGRSFHLKTTPPLWKTRAMVWHFKAWQGFPTCILQRLSQRASTPVTTVGATPTSIIAWGSPPSKAPICAIVVVPIHKSIAASAVPSRRIFVERQKKGLSGKEHDAAHLCQKANTQVSLLAISCSFGDWLTKKKIMLQHLSSNSSKEIGQKHKASSTPPKDKRLSNQMDLVVAEAMSQ